MVELRIEATVKKIKKVDERDKDTENDYAVISFERAIGPNFNIKLNSNEAIGLTPKDPVMLTIKSAQQTVTEAMQGVKDKPKKPRK
jgi:hypothetical protein